jgi:hypothetical protein
MIDDEEEKKGKDEGKRRRTARERERRESGVSGGGRLHSFSFFSFLTKLVYRMVNIGALIGPFFPQLVSAMFCRVNSTITGM